MKKPLEMTPKGVCDLVTAGIREGGYSGPYGPNRTFARSAEVSPDVVNMITRNEFPGTPIHASEPRRRMYFLGKVFTLTRVCDALELDLEACIEACGLPLDKNTIGRSRMTLSINAGRGELRLDLLDLEMLKAQFEILGPIPVSIIRALVEAFRKREAARE